MALYEISEDDVARALEGISVGTDRYGRNEVTDHRQAGRYGYPLKVIYNEDRGRVTVITAYPLKRERKK